jgi:hypothetical protein
MSPMREPAGPMTTMQRAFLDLLTARYTDAWRERPREGPRATPVALDVLPSGPKVAPTMNPDFLNATGTLMLIAALVCALELLIFTRGAVRHR